MVGGCGAAAGAVVCRAVVAGTGATRRVVGGLVIFTGDLVIFTGTWVAVADRERTTVVLAAVEVGAG